MPREFLGKPIWFDQSFILAKYDHYLYYKTINPRGQYSRRLKTLRLPSQFCVLSFALHLEKEYSRNHVHTHFTWNVSRSQSTSNLVFEKAPWHYCTKPSINIVQPWFSIFFSNHRLYSVQEYLKWPLEQQNWPERNLGKLQTPPPPPNHLNVI